MTEQNTKKISGTQKRLREFIEHKRISGRQFEISSNLSNGFLGKVGNSIQEESLDKISKAFPDLNTSWLLVGEGEMIKSDQKSHSNDNPNSSAKKGTNLNEPPTSNMLTKSAKAVPVFDVNFSAGTLLNLMDLRDNQFPIAWLNIPEVVGCDAVIRARGNSMEPVIRDGDWIAIKQESNWQEWLPKNYIYAISTSTMMLIKYISEITETHFTIASANEFYKDDTIPKKFIHDVWSVKTVLPFSQIVTLV